MNCIATCDERKIRMMVMERKEKQTGVGGDARRERQD